MLFGELQMMLFVLGVTKNKNIENMIGLVGILKEHIKTRDESHQQFGCISEVENKLEKPKLKFGLFTYTLVCEKANWQSSQ